MNNLFLLILSILIIYIIIFIVSSNYEKIKSFKRLINLTDNEIELYYNSYDKICVVENLADMWVIDSANIYKGHYHILGGTLNSSENYEQKNLLIESLLKRIKKII